LDITIVRISCEDGARTFQFINGIGVEAAKPKDRATCMQCRFLIKELSREKRKQAALRKRYIAVQKLLEQERFDRQGAEAKINDLENRKRCPMCNDRYTGGN
jgi:hypothetical protein